MVSLNTDSSYETSTNVQVTLRVKPRSDKESVILKVPKDPQMVVVVDKPFTFDHVAWENSSQEEVYNVAAKNLVVKALQGYNGTILAYGQTGTGKTYTMGSASSSANDPSRNGLTHRCLSRIFERSEAQVSASFMEIYNEELHDLLNTRVRLTMRNGVPTPRVQPILSLEEGISVIDNALKFRQTTSTKLNSASSRSHALLTLHLKVQDGENIRESKLNLVDLAGSENVKRTQAQGLTFLEGRNINQSLLALSSVIAALSKNTTSMHVPYRNSVLTSTLQDCLGGKSLISLVACVSPDPEDLYESTNTMRFAKQAKMVKIKPDQNVVFTKFLEKNRSEIKRLFMVVSPSIQDYSTVGGQTPSLKRRVNLPISASKKVKTSFKTPGSVEQNKAYPRNGYSTPILSVNKELTSIKSKKNSLQTPLKIKNNTLTRTEKDNVLQHPRNAENTVLSVPTVASVSVTPGNKTSQRSRMENATVLSLNKENSMMSSKVYSTLKTPKSAMSNKKNILLDVASDYPNPTDDKNLEVFVAKLDKLTNVLKDATNFVKAPMTPMIDKTYKTPLQSHTTPHHTSNAINDDYKSLLRYEKTVENVQTKLDHMVKTVMRTKSFCSKTNAEETENSPFNDFKIPKLLVPRPRRPMLPPSCSDQATPKVDRKVTARKCLAMENDPDCENVLPTMPIEKDREETLVHGRRSARLILKRQSENSFEVDSPKKASNEDEKRRSRLSLRKTSSTNVSPNDENSVLFQTREQDQRSELEATDDHCSQIDDAEQFTVARNIGENLIDKMDNEFLERSKREQSRRRSARINNRRKTVYVSPLQEVAMPKSFNDFPSNDNKVSLPTLDQVESSEFGEFTSAGKTRANFADKMNDEVFELGKNQQNRRRSARISNRRQTIYVPPLKDVAVAKSFNDIPSDDNGVLLKTRDLVESSKPEAADRYNLQIDDAAESESSSSLRAMFSDKMNDEVLELGKNQQNRRRSARIINRRQTIYVPPLKDVAVAKSFNDIPSDVNGVLLKTRVLVESSKPEAADRYNLQINDAAESESSSSLRAMFSDKIERSRRRSVRLSSRRQTIYAPPKEDVAAPKEKSKSSTARETVSPERNDRPIQCRTLNEKQVLHNRKILGILNEGNLGQLKTLARIGPKTAMILYQYRDLNGKFGSFDDLTNVAGWTKAFVSRLLLANNVVLE